MQFVRFIACVIAVPVIAIALVFACWIVVALPSRAEILVINDSNKTLSELTVHGSCKERRAEALGPSLEWNTTVWYHGPIQISFMANRKHYAVGPEMSTNDSGFRAIEYMIDSNLTVKCNIRG